MKPAKTGIISDARMQEHRSKKNHPESPLRLTSLLALLHASPLLAHPALHYLPSYPRLANDEELGLVYPEKYLSYVRQLWPKASHRTDITVLDTYFCEHSERIARMSAGGVLEGVDQLMAGKWGNGFALVRPPGHHSGGKNTINGFCIFNNVAIAARYLQKRYSVQKILILDYDVHHGDGTHHIFNDDPSVLFVSVHRHDQGAYYPAGEGGSVGNCGVGAGEGSKVNIPLNYVRGGTQLPFQAPGDNEYIYLYNRIIHPIVESFAPDFILVSSGFDAARNDPVGGFTATPNAYYYITRRLLEFGKPLLCVLEGGYNLQSLGECAKAVLQALLEEPQLPQPIPQLEFKDLAALCHLQKEYHQDLDVVIEHHSKYWKALLGEEQVRYSQAVKGNKEKRFGVVVGSECAGEAGAGEGGESTTQFYFAAGHMQRFKNFSINNDRILKWAYPEERKFYESDFPERLFAPHFYGTEGEHVVIENLLYKHQDPIILDVKLSRQSKNPHNTPEKVEKELKKEALSTSHKYAFRIGGFTTPLYKEGGMLISDEATNRKILKKAVTSENKQLFCTFLRGLAAALRECKRHYFGTSILLIRGKERSSIKWVDFHYWYEQEGFDADVVEGLENLEQFILSVDETQ